MTVPRSVLVPIDFSDASRGALRYATALAHHLEAELRVVTVADPLLMEAALLRMSAEEVTAAVRKDLEAFCRDALEGSGARPTIRYEIATGKPAVEILRLTRHLCRIRQATESVFRRCTGHADGPVDQFIQGRSGKIRRRDAGLPLSHQHTQAQLPAF